VETLKTIQLQRSVDGQLEDASIVRLTSHEARKMIDETWWNLPAVPMAKLEDEGDHHWNWEIIVKVLGSGVLEECVAIMSKDGYIEGAITYRFNAKSYLEPNEGCVYIERVSTAPRNRSWLVSQPLYKGIGSTLLYWAVRESYLAGLRGRVSLESLLTATTIRFYEDKGFVRTDLSQKPPNLFDYELPRAAAEAWLKKKGDLKHAQ
jgi:GNAT superfamily N-acetyltransferase